MSIIAHIERDREFVFDDDQFRFLASLANSKTGIMLPDYKKDMVYGRLVRRLRALKLGSFSEYCELLQSGQGEDEIAQMINAITTNLTSFFREAHHFRHLEEVVLAPLKSLPERRLRIWSAGCSSGMEPYTIAMVLRAAISDLDRRDTRILATDIDSNTLNTGMRGEYDLSDFEKVEDKYKKYVVPAEKPGRILVGDELKKLISFKRLNLLENWPMRGPFDAIFCRNVVIYFDAPTKKTLFSRMADLLKPQGWLYIGHSENLHGISDRFESTGRTIYRRVK